MSLLKVAMKKGGYFTTLVYKSHVISGSACRINFVLQNKGNHMDPRCEHNVYTRLECKDNSFHIDVSTKTDQQFVLSDQHIFDQTIFALAFRKTLARIMK